MDFRLLILAICCFICCSCSSMNVDLLVKSRSPIFEDDLSQEALEQAAERSLAYYKARPSHKLVSLGRNKVSIRELKNSLSFFLVNLRQMGLTSEFRDWVKENFNFYKANANQVLVTGYFEASLNGSKIRTDKFRYPIYAKPDDLVTVSLSEFPIAKQFKKLPRELRARADKNGKLSPYFTRDEIDFEDALSGRNLELVWVDDPLDVFFLHIQGSGVVRLQDGSILRLNFSDKNGHPYRAIGKYLVENKVMSLEEVSMQSIREYLVNNPDTQRKVFEYNPSYVFFREVFEGPIGSIGQVLTPGRSIATDPAVFPVGGLALLENHIPTFDLSGKISGTKLVSRFCLNQDTGGAIRGNTRVDLYTGNGPESELLAGHLKHTGSLYFLLAKEQNN